jgi:hypothetical protein
MRELELEAFTHWASPQTLRNVVAEGRNARDEWAIRIARPAELKDVAPFALGGWFHPSGAISAAAEVAVEVAIITAIWPERPSDVLRPSWE